MPNNTTKNIIAVSIEILPTPITPKNIAWLMATSYTPTLLSNTLASPITVKLIPPFPQEYFATEGTLQKLCLHIHNPIC